MACVVGDCLGPHQLALAPPAAVFVPAVAVAVFHWQRSDAASHQRCEKCWQPTVDSMRVGTQLDVAFTHAQPAAAPQVAPSVSHWHLPVAHTPPNHSHSTAGHASRSWIWEQSIARHAPVDDTSHRPRSHAAPCSSLHGFAWHMSMCHMHRDDALHDAASIPRHGISSHAIDPDTLKAHRCEFMRHIVALVPKRRHGAGAHTSGLMASGRHSGITQSDMARCSHGVLTRFVAQ